MSILVISFPETKTLAMKVARGLRAEYETISSKDFPDGELNVSLKKNPKNKEVVVISSMAKQPNKRIIETILAGGIAKDYGAKKVILFATYFPYMRQDRHFLKYDSFSSKYVSRLFFLFDKIITIAPHRHRIKNLKTLAKNLDYIEVNSLISAYIKKRFGSNLTVVGPDEESSQWSRPIAEALGKKAIVLKKHRYSPSRIRDEKTDAKFGRNVIVIDDIISTGKTMVGALELAKKKGAKNLVALGVHGVFDEDSVKQIQKHATLITTNTVPSRFSKIDVSPAIIKELKKIL